MTKGIPVGTGTMMAAKGAIYPVYQLMADQGAEVWKIESPAGDPAREQAPFEAGQSVWFRNLNRGKKSLALDLKSEAGKARLC